MLAEGSADAVLLARELLRSPHWPLLAAPNTVLSPHLAGATRQTAQRAAAIVADDVAAFLRGGTPRHVANPAVLEGAGLTAVAP